MRKSAKSTPRLNVERLEDRAVPAGMIADALDLPAEAQASFTGDQFAALGVWTNTKTGGLGGFPTGGNNKFVLLSTGDSTKAYAPRPASYYLGHDFGVVGATGDRQSMRVVVPISPGQTLIKFDFNMMTDEFPGDFNDTFRVVATPNAGGPPTDVVNLTVSDDGFLDVAPANAIYFRHTGRYTAAYKIPAAATSVQFDFTVADMPLSGGVHGGRYNGYGDTAVAIDNFQIESAKQTIWLNFEGGTLFNYTFEGLGMGDLVLPAFQPSDIRNSGTDRNVLINAVFNDVVARFAAYDIDFTLTQPVGISYGTCFVGGTGSNTITNLRNVDPRQLRLYGTSTPTIAAVYGNGLLGLADNVDTNNSSKSNLCFAMSGNVQTSSAYTGVLNNDLIRHLGSIIAHEVGHTLGLPHVVPAQTTNIMAQFAPLQINATFENTARTLVNPLSDGRTSLNNDAYLRTILGPTTLGESVNAASLANTKKILRLILPQPIFNAYFRVSGGNSAIGEEGTDDHGAEMLPPMNLVQGVNYIEIPDLGPYATISFYGSTTPGGEPDFFSGTPTDGEMTYDEGFVPLIDLFSGNPATSLPTASGALGSLTIGTPIEVAQPISSIPGDLVPIPKTGFVFTDDNGDSVTVKLTSKFGTGQIELNDPDSDGKGSITRIVLSGTTAADRLDITVRKGTGDGFVDVGSIQANALGTITAKSANLVGSGIDVGSALRSLVIHDVLNGADIATGIGAKNQATTITANRIGDFSSINLSNRLARLSAIDVGNSEIIAPSIGTIVTRGQAAPLPVVAGDFLGRITVTGNAATPTAVVLSSIDVKGALHAIINVAGSIGAISALEYPSGSINAVRATSITTRGAKIPANDGDFGADLTLTGVGLVRNAAALTTLSVAGNVLADADISVSGVSTISVKKAWRGRLTATGSNVDPGRSVVNSWRVGGAIDGGTIIVNGRLGSLTAASLTGTLTASSIGTLTATTGNIGAAITLTGVGLLPTANVLGTLTANAGTILGSTIRATGNIGRISALNIADSRIFAGYTGPDDGTGTFAGSGTIGSITTTGPVDSFVNSHVIATKIGSATFKSVRTTNGTLFGLISDTTIGSVRLTTPAFVYDSKNLDPQGVGDFVIKLV